MYSMDQHELGLRIAGLGHTTTSFARLLIALGDPRPEKRIIRNLTNHLNGSTKNVPGELIVTLNLLYRHPEEAKVVKPNRQGKILAKAIPSGLVEAARRAAS